MRFARPAMIAVMGIALGAYAFDCAPMTTLDQAMQCCDAMDCPTQGHHNEDCCQTAPSLHPPFVQGASVHGAACAPLVFAVLSVMTSPPFRQATTVWIGVNFHGPPGHLAAEPPLRI